MAIDDDDDDDGGDDDDDSDDDDDRGCWRTCRLGYSAGTTSL